MRLPVLVDCVPYKARVTEEACVKRWRMAQRLLGPKPRVGNDAIEYDRIRKTADQCAKCGVGAERAVKKDS